MKNKKSIYILLPAVLLIWALVLYQFFSFTNPEPEVGTLESDVDTLGIAELKRDTFSIDVNYRDPFLGKMYVAKKGVATIPKPKLPPAAPVVWPTIAYKGIISDTKDKNTIFMLLINGQSYLMEAGQTEEDILLKGGDRKMVKLVYQRQQREILLQE